MAETKMISAKPYGECVDYVIRVDVEKKAEKQDLKVESQLGVRAWTKIVFGPDANPKISICGVGRGTKKIARFYYQVVY